MKICRQLFGVMLHADAHHTHKLSYGYGVFFNIPVW